MISEPHGQDSTCMSRMISGSCTIQKYIYIYIYIYHFRRKFWNKDFLYKNVDSWNHGPPEETKTSLGHILKNTRPLKKNVRTREMWTEAVWQTSTTHGPGRNKTEANTSVNGSTASLGLIDLEDFVEIGNHCTNTDYGMEWLLLPKSILAWSVLLTNLHWLNVC